MRKGYKRRRGLVALLSAFVLVIILSVPMFAVDSSATVPPAREVVVSGTFVLEADSVLANYFELNTSYGVLSGTFGVYSSGGSLIGYGNETSLRVTSSSGTYALSCYAGNTPGSESQKVFVSSDSTYATAEFSMNDGRYLVFDHVHLLTSDPIYLLLTECAASTSTLTYSSSEPIANDILSVIVDGFNGIITGLGSGVADFFQTLFIANDGTGNLSTFAIVSLVFIGVAVAFGIARWIIKKVGQ